MTGNPKSLFFDWLTAPAEKSGQQVSSSRFGSKNRNVYLFIFFFLLLFGSIWILKTFSSCVNTKAMTTMTNIITGLWKNVFSSSFFYLLPQGVGTSEWKKVFFFFYLFIPERVSAHIQLMIWNISWNPTRTHIQRRPFFLTCFFFFVCASWTYSKAGPYFVILLCSFFFIFFIFEIQRSWHPYNNIFFFDRGICFFIFGWVGISLFWWTARKFRVTNFKGKIEADTNGIDFLWKTIFESPAADAVLPQNYKCRCVCV